MLGLERDEMIYNASFDNVISVKFTQRLKDENSKECERKIIVTERDGSEIIETVFDILGDQDGFFEINLEK